MTSITAEVQVGGTVSNNKGVNVPDVVVPIPALTEKDKSDLQFALEQGADWIALSFVQRPEDVAEARALIGDKAALMAKIEKPAAIDRLTDIIALADGVMVARGDLGVELPPEEVPPLQNRIVATARQFGKPVVVATQMLESMITSPTPTRAEVSDVATAIYDGADAVMLSAESAAGKYPAEAVAMMDRIANSVERDPGLFVAHPLHRDQARADDRRRACPALPGRSRTPSRRRRWSCFSKSGSTARRIARERPPVPILAMSPSQVTSRRMGLYWGVHSVHSRDVSSFEEMVGKAKRMALRHHLAAGGDRVVIMAGIPFGTAGSTNVLHVVRLVGDELERHTSQRALAREKRGNFVRNLAGEEADRSDLVGKRLALPRRGGAPPIAMRQAGRRRAPSVRRRCPQVCRRCLKPRGPERRLCRSRRGRPV